jgi:pimeloyl-ACP methyl ester carboxylesterase
MKQLPLLLILIAAMLLTACSAPAPTSRPPTPTPMPSGMVDVGGYELFYQCSGQGSPTVILEAGLGDGSSSSSYSYWARVIAGVAETTRVCAYDRANFGRSDEARTPRTFRDAARDLQALLGTARIGGPYILVGHSLGGELVRVFVDQYPEEVAGIVLVDAAHPDLGSRLLAGLPPEAADEPEGVMFWRRFLTWASDSNGSPYPNPEGWDTQASNAQVRATKPLGDLPLVVISRSPDSPLFAAGTPPLPTETNARLLQIWQDLQVELAGLSTNSTHVMAVRAGHQIPNEEPALVVDAILELANEIRSR